jgi:D-alanyl-D-alanine carboxypeptidase
MGWRKGTGICRTGIGSCAVSVCAVSVFAIAVTASPVAARHSSHHASHGVHERHGRHEHDSAKDSAKHESSYTPPYAAIVLDAGSGKVLHSDKADELRHPASLTKIMTLYLLFEKLDAGKIRLDSQLPVSEHASAQAPTKLGLRPGQTIEVEDAIRGLVTKSANDAAVAIAEAIGGSEHDFAELMTAKAHAIGMSHTVYRNASGLPNDEQVTTARDQAALGRAINDRFPRYYRYFATPTFTWQGETLRNHNHLLGRVEGMDGIKTGYTQASGFNLVASVRRNDRHIVSVVMGGTSAGARDARMRSLIEDYINAASPQKTLVASTTAPHREEARKEDGRREEARKDEARLTAMIRSATAGPVPEPRPKSADTKSADTKSADTKSADTKSADTKSADAGPGDGAPAPGTYSVASAATDPIKPIQVKTLKVRMAPAQVAALVPAPGMPTPAMHSENLRGENAAAPQNTVAAPAKRESGHDLIAEAIRETAPPEESAPTRSAEISPARAAPPPPPSAPPAVHTGWMIQVGAFDIEQEARDRINVVQAKAGQMLKHANPFTEAVTAGEKTLYRARFAGIQKDQAEAICKQLKRNDIACMTIKN